MQFIFVFFKIIGLILIFIGIFIFAEPNIVVDLAQYIPTIIKEGLQPPPLLASIFIAVSGIALLLITSLTEFEILDNTQSKDATEEQKYLQNIYQNIQANNKRFAAHLKKINFDRLCDNSILYHRDVVSLEQVSETLLQPKRKISTWINLFIISILVIGLIIWIGFYFITKFPTQLSSQGYIFTLIYISKSVLIPTVLLSIVAWQLKKIFEKKMFLDKQNNQFWKITSDVFEMKRQTMECKLSDIKLIQAIHLVYYDYEDGDKDSYEVNFVMSDYHRVNVINSFGKVKSIQQAEILSKFLNVPIVSNDIFKG